MSLSKQLLVVDVVSDVVCPWCYIGKRRLEAAIELVPELDVQVRWRPFQLDPTIPQGGLDRAEYMNKKFGAERYREISQRITQTGEDVGIKFHFSAIKRAPNTLDAHRVIRWADTAGVQGPVKEALMQAFFVDARNIGEVAVLADVAATAGMDRALVERLLAGEADKQAVREEIDMAQKIGVSGVPFFIFAQKLGVSGAQPAQVLRDAMMQALA